jgi:hypothetical protein
MSATKTKTPATPATPATPTDQPTPTAPTAVTLRQQAPSILQDDLDDYAGAGTSDDRRDNIVPFLSVLQKGSPQVNDKKSGYIPGAKPGMLFNSATQRIYEAEPDGIGPTALQGFMEVIEVEWIPRAQGGGFVARHPLDTPLLNQITEMANPQSPDSNRKLRMLPNGHQLVTTAYHYLILTETLEPVVVALTSTGMQTHRRWNTMYRNKKVRNRAGQLVVAPSFATLVRLRTFWSSNDVGDWYSLAVDDLGWTEDMESYETTRDFHKLALTGAVAAAAPPTEDGDTTYASGSTSQAAGTRGTDLDSEIPF